MVYGVDIRDLGTVRLTAGRCRNLIDWLPDDAPLNRVLHPEYVGWSVLAAKVANVEDLLSGGNWQRAGFQKGKYPKPTWRPEHYQADQARLRSAAAVEARLSDQAARMRAKRGR